MSIRQAVVIAIVCGIVAVGRLLYGREFFLWYLVIVGAFGLAGPLANENTPAAQRES